MDNRPEKVVELKPSEWTSDREKPHEPVFGPGAWSVLPYWLSLFATMFVVHAIVRPDPAPAAPKLRPGQSVTIDGVTITRTN